MITVERNPHYCGECCDAAQKAGRPVRMTDVGKYPLCSLCESRIRNGLAHYRPSNGTEWGMFEGRCYRCRHHIPDHQSGEPNPVSLTQPFGTCTWGVKDRVIMQMWEPRDHVCNWFDPADLDATTCPATCKRFTPKDDPHGELRDPPKPDVEGQMFLGDVLEVTERVPEKHLTGRAAG